MSRIITASVLLLAVSAMASASIIDVQAADDGDGVITCSTQYSAETNANYLTIDGVHHYPVTGQGLAGHVLVEVTTDTEEDPTLTIGTSIDNDTTFAWTEYLVNISMNKVFTIDSAQLFYPSGWDFEITGPTQVGAEYVGSVRYFMTTGEPIAIGDPIDFEYEVSFVGGVTFTQEMIPAPEPATLGLLALGGLALIRRRRA